MIDSMEPDHDNNIDDNDDVVNSHVDDLIDAHPVMFAMQSNVEAKHKIKQSSRCHSLSIVGGCWRLDSRCQMKANVKQKV